MLSQGGVLYNAPLRRYLYTSWTEYTWEFYEAPQPWGPWKLFLHKDFGPYPWWGEGHATPKNGGYATTVPSKFVGDDGRSMWVQANWFVGNGEGTNTYHFAVRPLTVVPYAPSTPGNEPDPGRNLATAQGTVATDKTSHYGHLGYLNDGATTSEDSWDGGDGDVDWWGYTWPVAYTVDRAVYTTGEMFGDGGWFASGLTVQARKEFRWTEVTGLTVDPAYPYDDSAGPGRTYTFRFDATACDGVRIVGTPGGTAAFTSIGELAVHYAG